MNNTQAQPQPCMHFVVMPQRERVTRNESDLRAFRSGDCGATYERILVGITTSDVPLRSNTAVSSELVAIRALAAGLQNSGGIVWISGPGVDAVLSISRGGQRQIAMYVPLH